MSSLIIFMSMGLVTYWFARTLLLLNAPKDQVEEVLAADLWRGRRILLAIRSLVTMPNQFAG